MRRRTAAMRQDPFGPVPDRFDDAYCHLPQLRDRIAPAATSTLRLTPEVLAQWDERARVEGRGVDWRWSDAQLEATRQALLGPLDDGEDLWVFGYGSLMWDPGIPREPVLQHHCARYSAITEQGQRRRPTRSDHAHQRFFGVLEGTA